MAAIKRIREEDGDSHSIDMAKYLVFLSQTPKTSHNRPWKPSKPDVVFECRTCGRKFPSFQALGGHRASHKRPRTTEGEATKNGAVSSLSLGITKPKVHECSICGQEFGLGQALGGHMRKHRVSMADDNGGSGHFGGGFAPKTTAVLRRTSSSKRVFGVDLNLTPLENDLEILFGKKAPKIDVSMV